MSITIHTDGACRGNPGPGGYAAIVDDGTGRKELWRGYRWTTNNRMEIRSVIAGLEEIEPDRAVHLVSDSQYLLNTLSKGWIVGWKKRDWISTSRQPVKNRDLWEQLDLLVARRSMTYQWVRGHASHPLNNRCDELAVAAALGATLHIDSDYEAINSYRSNGAVDVVALPTPAGVAQESQAQLPGFSDPLS
jgi:ribonuclease HI